MDLRRPERSGRAPRQSHQGGPAMPSVDNVPSHMTDNVDYLSGMGSGIDPNTAYDIRTSRDDFVASLNDGSLNDGSSSSTAVPEQSQNDRFESTSPASGYPYDSSGTDPSLFGITGPVQQFGHASDLVDRLLVGNAPSYNGEASSSDVEHSYRPSFSLTGPLTSNSSQDIVFSRPIVGDIPFHHRLGGDGSRSHYFGPAATLSSHSGPRSEVLSEQDEDLMPNSQVTSGFRDQLFPSSVPGYVRGDQSNQPHLSQHSRQANPVSITYGYSSTTSTMPRDGRGGLTIATSWGQQYQPNANTFSPSSNPDDTGGTWGYHGTNTQASSPGDPFAGTSHTVPYSASSAYRDNSMAIVGDVSPQYLSVPPPPRQRRRSEPPNPNCTAGNSRGSMHRTTSHRATRFQESISPRASISPYPLDHPLERPCDVIPKKPARGRRRNKLSNKQKLEARAKRENKSTCINCKYSRSRCDIPEGKDVCSNCSKAGRKSKCPRTCTRADFIERVEKGPLDLVALHSINHEMTDGTGRRRLPMPKVVDCQHLRQALRKATQQELWGCIRVSLGQDVLYDLDLMACDNHLEVINPELGEAVLRKVLVDDMRKNRGEWRNLAYISDPKEDDFENLIRRGEMLGRQTFTLISTRRSPMMLDPDDPSHLDMFHVAGIFSRIFSRGMELSELNKLQKRIQEYNEITPGLTVSVGRYLFILRWKLSWLKYRGSGVPDVFEGTLEQDEYTDRLTKICKTLYFYFITILEKENSRLTGFLSLDQWKSIYVDVPPNEVIYEGFPREDSPQGFDDWMKEGLAKLEESGVQDRVIYEQGHFYGLE